MGFGKRLALAVIASVSICCLWSPPVAVQAQDDGPQLALILLHPDADLQTSQVLARIEANDGRPLHVFPQQGLIAQLSELPGTAQALAALPGVAAVFTQKVEPSTVDRLNPNAHLLAEVWNALIAPPRASDPNMTLMSGGDRGAAGHERDDALVAPDLPSTDGMSLAATTTITPGYYQTSEYMIGAVAVGIVLVESDGSVDPSTEDWTSEEKQRVFNEIVTALSWWADLEPRAGLSFVYDDHFSEPLPTAVEPISRPQDDEALWIADAMGALGYDAHSPFTRVRDYNNDLRAAYQTDWSFTIFVVDSSADADNRFDDGYFAYAYLGGPFMVMTYGNGGYGPGNMDAVAAHEMGHIFHALDQYSAAAHPCTRRSGYLDVENQNSQYGDCVSDVASIMRGQLYPFTVGALDPYGAGQIGWRDSDDDGVFDPLDTDLPVDIDAVSITGGSVTISGTASITPYPSPSRRSVTINTLTGVQYRVDGGEWQQAEPGDGAFDEVAEEYHLTAFLSPGLHTLEVAALDSAGNVSAVYATETIAVLDPVDGGLTTDLESPCDSVSASDASTLAGIAYHLEGGAITGVQYRIDGGAWQGIGALDGAFDSDYEPFAVAVDSLEEGTHLIEARAVDSAGSTEVNFASREITIVDTYTVFLPVVVAGGRS